MTFVGGPINKQLLQNILAEAIEDCVRVRAAVAYASSDNLLLFEHCFRHDKPLQYYGRYDHTVPVHPDVLKWFLDHKSPGLVCKLVPDILHAKVIWWEGVGAYIGSANISERAWSSNIEAGVYVEQAELEAQGLDHELENFFELIDSMAYELTLEIYQEVQLLSDSRNRDVNSKDFAAERNFDKTRRIPKNKGLILVEKKGKGDQRRFESFSREWASTLQLMRDLGARISQDESRPAWLASEIPAGVQADQFLHAYYYQRVREGAGHPYESFYKLNSKSPEQCLKDTIGWWKSGSYDHSHEEKTVYEWAPALRQFLAESRILTLSESEFVAVVGMVHAMRDHASKQKNVKLGLTDSPQANDVKIEAFGKWLYATRSAEGRSPLETINHVLYGGSRADVAKRLWVGSKDPAWRIPHMNLSSLGEIVGWAMPDMFPPRNMRSSKALRALGNNVSIYL